MRYKSDRQRKAIMANLRQLEARRIRPVRPQREILLSKLTKLNKTYDDIDRELLKVREKIDIEVDRKCIERMRNTVSEAKRGIRYHTVYVRDEKRFEQYKPFIIDNINASIRRATKMKSIANNLKDTRFFQRRMR